MIHRKPAAATLALASLLGLSACGGDNSSSATPPSLPAGEGQTSIAATGTAPADKDTLVIVNGAEASSLDPQKSQDTVSSAIIRQMFDGLVSTDAEGKTVPGLAEKWETQDNKVWTLTLRDAKWSNGDPITAHDAVYALRRLVDPNTGAYYASYLADAKVVNAEAVATGKAPLTQLGVAALDDKTLQITLTEAVPYFIDMLALPVTFPVHQKTIETHGDQWLNPENIVVSGAYKLQQTVVGSHTTLVKNPEYYDAAKATIEKVQFLPVPAEGGINRYRAGEVDVSLVPGDQFEKVQAESGSEIQVSPRLCTYYLEPNVSAAPLDNPRVREALSMAIVRETFPMILKRGEQPAYQLTPLSVQGMQEVAPKWQSMNQEARNQKAKELLAEAGYTADKPLEIEFLYSSSETGKKLSSAINAMWTQNLGGAVKASQINQEWKSFLDTKNQGDFSLALSGWCADYNEPSSFLNLLKTGNSNNTGKYSSSAYDNLLARSLSADTTDEARAGIYKDLEVLIGEETAVMPLYTAVGVRLVKPYIGGFSTKDPLDGYLVKDLTINK